MRRITVSSKILTCESGYANNHAECRGAVAVVAIPGGAVPGRVNPRAGSLFWLFPIHWTVGGIATGGGADGEGAKSPLPCLSGFNAPASPTPGGVAPEKPEDHPPCLSGFNMPASPTPPGLRPPPSPRGAGGSHSDPGAYPHTLDRGDIAPRGRGQKVPSPVSGFNMPTSPTPPGLRPPPSPRGAGGSRSDPGEGRTRESEPPHPHGCVFDGSHPR